MVGIHHSSLLNPLQSDAQPGSSFQLMGEDLVRLTWDHLGGAVDQHRAQMSALPERRRTALAVEHEAWAQDSQRWLRKYNHNVYTRIAGYLELGFECRFRYPWPVVAILGIRQVLSGMARARMWGLIGAAANRVRMPLLEQLAEGTDDILRRTNRGIFADSVPLVLFALRSARHIDSGDERGKWLLDGPAPPLLDENSLSIARQLALGLQIEDPAVRFRSLADLTLEHFAREQAVFSHHMGAMRTGVPTPVRGWAKKMTAIPAVPAPRIEKGARKKAQLVFGPYKLPSDFDMRDHQQRVREFGKAFVRSITGSVDDYRVAGEFVVKTFDRKKRTLPTDDA